MRTSRLSIISAVFGLALATPLLAQEAEQRTSVARLSADVKQSITRGLEAFAASQNPDGSWGQRNRSGGTALGLMSFMLQGHIPGEGKYGEAMSKAIGFILSVEKNGYFHDTTDRGMYEHGLALLALSEAWGQSQDPRIRPALIRAVNTTLNAQNSEGGWRYTPRPTSADTSCSAMQIVALASAKESGIAVPAKNMQRAVDYIVSNEVRSTGGFAYSGLGGGPLGGAAFPRSAACTLALMLSGEHKHPATRAGVAYIGALPDSIFENEKAYYYGHYYAVQAMYQAGDEQFNKWYPKISAALLAKQDKNGGWGDPNGFSAVDTGFAILILGVPYRFLPIYQK
jgi:hypothetical protein